MQQVSTGSRLELICLLIGVHVYEETLMIDMSDPDKSRVWCDRAAMSFIQIVSATPYCIRATFLH